MRLTVDHLHDAAAARQPARKPVPSGRDVPRSSAADLVLVGRVCLVVGPAHGVNIVPVVASETRAQKALASVMSKPPARYYRCCYIVVKSSKPIVPHHLVGTEKLPKTSNPQISGRTGGGGHSSIRTIENPAHQVYTSVVWCHAISAFEHQSGWEVAGYVGLPALVVRVDRAGVIVVTGTVQGVHVETFLESWRVRDGTRRAQGCNGGGGRILAGIKNCRTRRDFGLYGAGATVRVLFVAALASTSFVHTSLKGGWMRMVE